MRNRRLREKHSRPRERRCKDPQTRGSLRARGLARRPVGLEMWPGALEEMVRVLVKGGNRCLESSFFSPAPKQTVVEFLT